ncbi:hypothetical protein K661_01264 [Piscirickettsia salmonis LF-89 = ATCC VR-1361]|nr:hypothetical protein K661_01264 [Piscirickettsia salmonis LF-89 = ATCC VR-1361]
MQFFGGLIAKFCCQCVSPDFELFYSNGLEKYNDYKTLAVFFL